MIIGEMQAFMAEYDVVFNNEIGMHVEKTSSHRRDWVVFVPLSGNEIVFNDGLRKVRKEILTCMKKKKRF